MLVLASASPIRLSLLRAAGVVAEARPVAIDEDEIRRSLVAEGATPHDIADTLAEMKARKRADKEPGALVLGCDQVLEIDRQAWGKAETPEAARAQLQALRGRTHRLLSAAVVFDRGEPVWRHVGQVRLTMRSFSDAYLDSYLSRNWDNVRHAVGCYKLEEEGARLFSQIEGDYFTVLGLPLLPLLDWLAVRGYIQS